MHVGSLVKKVRDGQLGRVVAIKGTKVRVASVTDPNCVWRLQQQKNYLLVSDDKNKKADEPVLPAINPISFDRTKPCTRAQYREKFKLIGLELGHDSDVLHIISKANGGADHVDNYFFLGNMRLNRKLGNRADEIYCYLCGLEGTKRAVAASVKFGAFSYHYIPPEKLYERGLERFAALF